MINRREVIKAGAVAATAAAIGVNPVWASKKKTSDVVVVGGGLMGAWTALNLLKSGASVTLVDEFGAGNSVGSSGGRTRVMRAHYGERILYTKMAIRAAELWTSYQEEWGETMLVRSDIIRIGPESFRPHIEQEKKVLASFGIEIEGLDQDEMRARWPQISLKDSQMAAYSSGRDSKSAAAGSIILARKSCGVVIDRFLKMGGKFISANVDVSAIAGVKQAGSLTLSTGEVISADKFVFACGPWMPELFPDVLERRLNPESRLEWTIEPPKDNNAFAAPNFPLWGIYGHGYGTPDVEGQGFKIAQDGGDQDEERALNTLKSYFPDLGTRIRETRHCYVTETATSDFVIDEHPGADRIWLVCGGSGHAAKHGPAIGEHAAAKVLGKSVDAAYDEAFRLKEV